MSPALVSIFRALPSLWGGLLTTLEVSAIVVGAALVAGTVLGAALAYGPRFMRWPIRVLADIIRGVPILVLIFFVYYVVPASGLRMSGFTAAVLALSLFSTAQVIEITRGACQSIHHGQLEAGKAIGLTFAQTLIWVVFPQALRRFLPPWLNSVTDAVKGSALVSLVGIVDLMQSIQQVIGRTYEPLPMYIVGAVIYFAINFTLSSLSRSLEARTAAIRD
jgi:polar amino acid transport system permease protein